jgi:hypothetical protein
MDAPSAGAEELHKRKKRLRNLRAKQPEGQGKKPPSERAGRPAPLATTCARTAIEHRNIVITVVSLIRDSERLTPSSAQTEFVTTVLGGALEDRAEAAQALRGLIERIVLRPDAKRGQIDAWFHGELGTILSWTAARNGETGHKPKLPQPQRLRECRYQWLRGHAATAGITRLLL